VKSFICKEKEEKEKVKTRFSFHHRCSDLNTILQNIASSLHNRRIFDRRSYQHRLTERRNISPMQVMSLPSGSFTSKRTETSGRSSKFELIYDLRQSFIANSFSRVAAANAILSVIVVQLLMSPRFFLCLPV
jgi:hypothetical protein